MTEYMDIVNEKNEVVGTTTKEEIYDRKLPHRIVHVFVINPKTKEIYLQQRAATVSFLPGYYCTSAGGHVQAGESYKKAAQRELQEELGLSTPVKKVATFPFNPNNHQRYIELYLSFTDSGFNFSDGEVASGEFMDLEILHELVKKDKKIHPQLTVCANWLMDNKHVLQE